MMIQKKDKKVAIITGGSGYLGKAITDELIKSGFFVITIDFNVSGKEVEVNEMVRSITGDITDEDLLKETALMIKEEFGEVSVLIHTASAPLIRKKILDLSMKDFTKQFDANVFGAFNFFSHLCPIISSKGVIIGITSKAIDANTSHSLSGSYIPAKYALKGLLRVLFNELKERGIRVYAIAPAFMMGGLNNDIPEKVREFIKNKSDPKEITTKELVAEKIIELINDIPGMMNGRSITMPEGSINYL